MRSEDLTTQEFLPQYGHYIGLVPKAESLLESLQSGKEATVSFLKSLPEDKLDYRYAAGKWTPREILLHCIDAERVFGYRALRFARKDKTPILGFEQDDYIVPSKAENRSIQSLISEYEAVRAATIALFESMDDEMLKSIGIASSGALSARAAGFIIAGHDRSHIAIIKERYL